MFNNLSWCLRNGSCAANYVAIWQTIIFFVQTGIILSAAAFAYRQIRHLRESNQANLLSQLLAELASPEMIRAERALRRWEKDHPADFAERFEKLLVDRDPLGDAIDDHRQFVFRYFYLVKHLCETPRKTPLLDETLVYDPLFCNSTAHKIVLDILEPLTEVYERVVLNPSYDVRVFDYYREKFHWPGHILTGKEKSPKPFKPWRPPANR